MNRPPPLISVVIPAYNRRDSVLALLADIHRQQEVSFEVIVVDDRSPDDTVAAIHRHFPDVQVLENASNGGPSVSRNRGARAAKGQYIVGFDSDVTVPDTTLFRRIVTTFAEFPEITTLALRVMAADGVTDDAPRWCHPFPIEPYADLWVRSDYFSGTGYAFRRETMSAAKFFPEILYMHHEEVELAYRTLDVGGSILHCPDLQLLHHPHPVADRNKIDVYYNPRNQILIAISMFPWAKAASYIVPRMAYQFGRALFRSHLGSYLRAMRDALRLLPKQHELRQPLQRSTLRTIARLRRAPLVVKRPPASAPAAARSLASSTA